MPRIIVFDVNETLLDVSALEPHFVRVFGEARALREWFSILLLHSEVVTIAGPYTEFGHIGRAALDMLATARGIALTPLERDEIVGGMQSLPAHADVRESLQRLRDAGLRLATLTNNAPAVVQRQLDHAGLTRFFERTLSVGAVQKFKPAPEVYRYAAKELAAETHQIRMVAAHGWDVYGAMRAGCAAAFVARSGQTLFPLGPPPDIVGRDLREVAKRIIDVESAGG